MKETVTEVEYPIRLIIGLNANERSGFSVIYEKPDGSAGGASIWYNGVDFGKIKFVDGNSFIKLDKIEKKANFLMPIETSYVVKEVVINRNFMNKAL